MSDNGRGPTRHFTVAGTRYDWPSELTGREMLYLEQETGLRAGELDEAAQAGSTAALLAMVVVAMRRSGRPDAELDDILDLPLGSPAGVDFLEDDGRPTEGAEEAEPAEPTPPARTGRRRSAAPSASARGKSST